MDRFDRLASIPIALPRSNLYAVRRISTEEKALHRFCERKGRHFTCDKLGYQQLCAYGLGREMDFLMPFATGGCLGKLAYVKYSAKNGVIPLAAVRKRAA